MPAQEAQCDASDKDALRAMARGAPWSMGM